MPNFSPWVQQAQQQALAVSSPIEGEGSTPEEQMMSQDPIVGMDPEDAQMFSILGKQTAQQNPEFAKRVLAIKQKGPMSQVPVTDQQQQKDMLEQYNNQAKNYMDQQQQGITQFEDNLNQMRREPRGIDFTGAASWAKFLNPENDMTQAAAAMKPETKEQREDKIMKLQDMLQQRKADMSKESLTNLADMIKARKAMDPIEIETKLSMIKKNNALAEAMGARPAQFDRGIAERAHQNILTKLATNKSAQQKLQAIQGIDNAGKIIEDAPTVTPQIFHDYQQALVGAIQRGNSGIAERAERYMKSTGIDAATVKQYLTGQPVQIPQGKENALYQATQGFAKSERANIGKQYNQILNSVSSGQQHIYDKHPELKADLDTAIKQYGSMAEPSAPTPAVDADPSKMSNEELKAWLAAHGG